MAYKELKQLRAKHNFTLKKLASKVGYGTGNLSSYENGKIYATDPTLMRILTRGYRMGKRDAKALIAVWRTKELENKYNLRVSHETAPYNEDLKLRTLDDFLRAEGLDEDVIEKIKSDIAFYKKKI